MADISQVPFDPSILFKGLDLALDALRDAASLDLSPAARDRVLQNIELLAGGRSEIDRLLPDFQASLAADRQKIISGLSEIEVLKTDIASRHRELEALHLRSRERIQSALAATPKRVSVPPPLQAVVPEQTEQPELSPGSDLVGWLMADPEQSRKPARPKIANIWESWNPTHQASSEDLREIHQDLENREQENREDSEISRLRLLREEMEQSARKSSREPVDEQAADQPPPKKPSSGKLRNIWEE